MTPEALAYYRVAGKGAVSVHSLKTEPDAILERRSYIRLALRATSWAGMNNDELDGCRLIPEGGGYILEDPEGITYIIKSGKVTAEETEFRRVRAMMPFEFLNLTGKDFDWNIYGEDTKEAREYINRFIIKFERFREKGMGLFIYSAVKGSGKTMLACCLLNELVKRYPVTVKFINALDLVELTKKGFHGEEDGELQGLYTAGVLVLDDIGVQMAREWTDTVFYRLINTRYNSCLVTIYTSNLSVQRLKMDERITDRIEGTTYAVNLPEVPVRSLIRGRQKEKIMQEIKKAPA